MYEVAAKKERRMSDDFIMQRVLVTWMPGRSLKSMVRMIMLAGLIHTGGNKRSAAKLLGIKERTYYDRLQAMEQVGISIKKALRSPEKIVEMVDAAETKKNRKSRAS